jgi:hypothetical protein
MEKCKVCGKKIKGAAKSAKRKDGSYYIICPNCNNVMLVTVSDEITTICRTDEGYNESVKNQMEEAYVLFKEAGVTVTQYIPVVNTPKKDASELAPKVKKKKKVVEEKNAPETVKVQTPVNGDLTKAIVNDEIQYVIASKQGIGYAKDKADLNDCLKNLDQIENVYELKKVEVKSSTKITYSVE